MTENCHKEDDVELTTAQEASEGKLSHAKICWKQVTTKRKKAPISPPTPMPSTTLSIGEVKLIKTLMPYSCVSISCSHERIQYHDPL